MIIYRGKRIFLITAGTNEILNQRGVTWGVHTSSSVKKRQTGCKMWANELINRQHFYAFYYLSTRLYCLSPVKTPVVELKKKAGKARHSVYHTEFENYCELRKRAIGISETKEMCYVCFRPSFPKSIQSIINRQSVALVLYNHFTPWPIYKPPRLELCPTSFNKFPFPLSSCVFQSIS